MSNRKRLINAIVFFANATSNCGKIKLFKLLYLLDFEHFRQTGKSVTGFEYQAWKFGPVPVDLMAEWEQLEQDLAAAVHIEHEQVIDYVRQTVKVNEGVVFDDEEFTARQLRIMSELAEKFKDTWSPAMIDVTHTQNGAWDKVWQNGGGNGKPIPYALAIPDDAPERPVLLEVAEEEAMFEAAQAALG
jgi:uncharacterized phage-associated protein